MIFFFRWVVGIWLVMKLSSDDLLDRLKKKGTRDSAYTKAMIIDKLNDNDADIASTNLKVTVSCPLGKMRMRVRLGKQFSLHIILSYIHTIILVKYSRFLVDLRLVRICNASMPPRSFK